MIDHVIPISVLEVIPAQIYSILKKEFDNQVYTFNSLTCRGVKFMKERTVPIDKVETDMITIMTATGDYGNQSVGSQHAMPYTFILEFITKAKNTPSKRGDEAAGVRLLKLMNTVRYILMSPSYLTLEIPTAIEGTAISKMQIYKDERVGDAENVATGQFLFTVNCEEVSRGNAGILLAGSDTSVSIELTAQGFEYGESYAPPLDPRYVYIRDKATGNVLGLIPGGEYYDVTTIKNIIDSFPNNQVNIVNNILP